MVQNGTNVEIDYLCMIQISNNVAQIGAGGLNSNSGEILATVIYVSHGGFSITLSQTLKAPKLLMTLSPALRRISTHNID